MKDKGWTHRPEAWQESAVSVITELGGQVDGPGGGFGHSCGRKRDRKRFVIPRGKIAGDRKRERET